MSDAISADGPDDRAAFESIVAGIDMSDVDSDRDTSAAQPVPAPPQQQADRNAAALVETDPSVPTPPEMPPFPLRHLEPVGLAMTVAMAAVGQILYWRGAFGGGVGGTLGAVAIAAAFEVLMIGGTDAAFHLKSLGRGAKRWFSLFLGGASAAMVAATVQLLHWEINMAIPFAAASFIGWAVHAIRGWIIAQQYTEARAEYDAEIARLNRKAEDRADAEYERQLAERETTRQAAARAAAAVEPEPRELPQRKPGKTPQSKKTSGKPRLDRATAVEWSRANGNASQAKVRAHFEARGYDVPAVSTLRGWINGH